jgi:hypothetical protein
MKVRGLINPTKIPKLIPVRTIPTLGVSQLKAGNIRNRSSVVFRCVKDRAGRAKLLLYEPDVDDDETKRKFGPAVWVVHSQMASKIRVEKVHGSANIASG